MDKIKFTTKEDALKPLIDYFGIKYGDDSLIDKYENFLKDLITENSLDKTKDFLAYSKPFDFFLSENLYSYFDVTKEIYQEDSKLTNYINSLGEFCLYILSKTREYDNVIKYFLTWQDLLYYIGFSIKGRILICKIYDLRGIDFFLSYNINDKRITAEENQLLFSFGDIIQKSLESSGRIEEAKLVLKDLSERKKNISKIVDEFSRKDPEKVLNNLRLYSERFWVDYLGRTTFHKLHPDSKSELIESIVSEELIKKNILTNASQIALSFCKVIERELNISLFDPFLLEYQNCIINPIPKEISKTQKRKIESRNFTIQTCKSCADKEHRLTFGQIVFLMRFWDDRVMNESSNLFHLISKKVRNFNDLAKSVNELLEYLELRNDKLTLVDIRNSSAHPTIDESINWDENIDWIKKLLGEPPKEILKRIVNELRES